MSSIHKVLVIGLDCASPELIFQRFRDDMPTISNLIQTGVYGNLKSTIPAHHHSRMDEHGNGQRPRHAGILRTFRNRADYAYNRLSIANSTLVNDDTVWDIISAANKKVILIGVPQTYPPQPVNGCLIASFLTPSNNSPYTYPGQFKNRNRARIRWLQSSTYPIFA